MSGEHWADVLGCDVRAGLPEIQRAAERRAREAMSTLRGEYLAAKLQVISSALDRAKVEKGSPHRRRRSSVGADLGPPGGERRRL